MDRNRPRSREKRVTGGSTGVHRRGSGQGTGPVGSSGGYHRTSSSGSSGGGSGTRARGGSSRLITTLIVLAVLFFGGSSFSGGIGSLLSNFGLGSLLGDSSGGSLGGGLGSIPGTLGGAVSSGWSSSSNTGKLNRSVASGSRAKYTEIRGGGKDTVTIMVYMCGTDLESRNGMATSDLLEMADATLSDKVNLLVYTGGCTKWQNKVISNKTNQIYQIKNGEFIRLVEDAGTDSMTNPKTLTSFITWCSQNYPANRNELIFWDHGGGSVSGYGYDEKKPSSGSMTLSGINNALKESGMTFDFIGFDACLMATMENALMLSQYADYMIASEETEPGYGWYYTNWLTELSKDTSLSTLDVGKLIADDFIRVCAEKGQGTNTTLSLVDLAELESQVPDAFRDFSRSASELIRDQNYQVVSNARSNTKEFSQSSRIDQVDLVHLAENMNNSEGKALAKALKSAIKYNRTSSSIQNAYGISIYFPYKKLSNVDTMVDTYKAIGVDDEYARCIQEFASVETAGQAASGGTGFPLQTLLGGSSSSGSSIGQDALGDLLGNILSGDYNGILGLNGSNTNFLNVLTGRDLESAIGYAADNQFDASALTWKKSGGHQVIQLSEDQWNLIQTLELNVFYDDGSGFIDLGLDNVFDFDQNGDLIGDYDRTWLAINGQPVAYYFLEDVEDGDNYTITGRVPALLNGERVDLLLVFDNANPYGYVAGARPAYDEEVTGTVAKSLTELKQGDRLDFLCDYYGYDGTFQDSYYLGEALTVNGELTISNVDIGDGAAVATYRFTDIYNKQYWTEPIK